MKAALVLAVAGAAVAQNLAGIPTCATGCLSSAISAAGCNPTDQGCQCGPTSASIGQLAVGCLLASCNAAALATAQSVGAALCSEYSATAGKAPATTSAPVTGATTTVTTGVTASASAATSTATVVVTSTSTSTSSSSSAAAPTTTVTSTAVVVNGTVTTHAPTTASVAGAGRAVVGAGALVAFLGAALAL